MQPLINPKSRMDARPSGVIAMPSENDDHAYTAALRQEVLELVPTAIPGPPGGTVYRCLDQKWTTPPMAVMRIMPDGLRGIVPYGTRPFNSVVTCSDGVRRCIRRIGGVHSLVWAEII